VRILPIVTLFLAVLTAALVACQAVAPAPEPTRAPRPSAKSAAAEPPALPTPENRTSLLPTPVAATPTGVRVTSVARGLFLPSALTFLPDGRLLFGEVQKGTLRILRPDGTLVEDPFATVPVVNFKEQGLLGIAIDPDYRNNRHVYVFYTHKDGNKDEARDNRIVRFTERDGVGTDRTKIIDELPSGKCCHNGGRITFGPDGKLYVSVGDQNDSDRAQNLNRLHGKILRLNPDGSAPADNPFVGQPNSRPEIFAFGFRNPWGMEFHPTSKALYLTENGEIGHDELNRVVRGGNYGNGEVDGIARNPRFVDPFIDSGVSRWGPTGMTFYTGRQMPEYANDLFFCAFNTGDLTRVRLTGDTLEQVALMEVVAKECRLDVTNAPDGSLYFSSITEIMRFGR
jgi:glucose/arabinose dehydrogenase